MSRHRQSALLLHGLSALDQHWILARLPAEDQRILGEHLSELRSLGIPADPALFDAMTGDASVVESARSSPRRAAADPLQAASGAQMDALLADEPVWLVRHVLALENWSWREDFLAAQTSARRERLKMTGGMTDDAPGPAGGKLAECLRAQLLLRLQGFDLDRAARQPVQTPQGLLSSVQQVVRRWL